MVNDLPPELMPAERERNAYNAAFYELGLRWHWDGDTYAVLLRHSAHPESRIRHYLETRQPHLLRAYDAEFLAGVIQERMARHRHCAAQPCDWSQVAGGEVGI
jgi:hypothetical protein